MSMINSQKETNTLVYSLKLGLRLKSLKQGPQITEELLQLLRTRAI